MYSAILFLIAQLINSPYFWKFLERLICHIGSS
ncbi:hypothetical protein BLA18109_02873 [Burkholderia lata]|uniref:Uncharacterized protein n=1 Tax=Burkholderia lata (strain ATCC 17760 / DSM 23089 / LMG 22485 / NCIMB 9086 / R18194 / 383) TaxID=482957 RepID=A0A6P2UKX7_BURL3|nr:hypothetical protein BLA18109_02873 [Burkholderia lata]